MHSGLASQSAEAKGNGEETCLKGAVKGKLCFLIFIKDFKEDAVGGHFVL